MSIQNYEQFLKNKVIVSEDFGFTINEQDVSPSLMPHQKDIVLWALNGGRRAVFASFGLGKSMMQLEIAKQCINKENKPFLIVCPLAVAGEFKRDNGKLNTGYDITYITDTDSIESYQPQIFITNYERVRMGDIDPSKFCGVSFDEASILRNLKTETTNYVIRYFQQVPYRFVATATPTPNDLIEILNYAVFLNVASRGHLLTRFFQRDSTKAGHLTLYPNKEKEFWQWVSTWAVFINKPSDLGYDNTGYDLPDLNIIEHCVTTEAEESYIDKDGKAVMFKDISKSLLDVAREKREGARLRCEKAYDLALQYDSAIVWHDLEDERERLEDLFAGLSYKSVYGSQPNQTKEDLLIQFSEGKYQYLLTKPRIAGSGCNLQHYCHCAIYAGIGYKFNDFLQALHRIYRFGQTKQVDVHIIYTQNEYEVLKVLYQKWELHKKLQSNMIELVKEYGLNKDIIKQQMERQIFKNGKKIKIGNAALYNNDTVVIHADKKEMPDNSIDLILTSIPFGDHYEYSDNYNDFGHNHGNHNFFEQMDYLTPNLLRVLKPGHVAAIHVKDRIRYSYQNGTSFTTIADFSGQTVAHFEKHGFYLMGKITVTTDVVRENNQTYRLGWTEQCKDATKMGCGMPEYVLLFRKAPTESNNAYADEPVSKDKDDYTCATWQLDAHAYYRSDGNRFLSFEELQKFDLKRIYNAWERYNQEAVYDYREHLRTCEYLEELGKLSKLFMTLPPHSNNDLVWTDINRMNTLNANQVSSKKEKHICPLQLDIIERLINRYTKKGDIVDDPFGGLFSTPYKALEMDRRAVSVELNSEYFKDGCFYVNSMQHKLTMPTLFDLLPDENKKTA
jgi:DNA modification methylase